MLLDEGCRGIDNVLVDMSLGIDCHLDLTLSHGSPSDLEGWSGTRAPCCPGLERTNKEQEQIGATWEQGDKLTTHISYTDYFTVLN